MNNENDNGFKPNANYAVILRCDIEAIPKVTEALKQMDGVRIVYQRVSTRKLFITNVPPDNVKVVEFKEQDYCNRQ